jgi:hypothetical protein
MFRWILCWFGFHEELAYEDDWKGALYDPIQDPSVCKHCEKEF